MTADELLALLPADLEAELRLGDPRRTGLALRVSRRGKGTPAAALVRVPPVFGPQAEGLGETRSLEADVLVPDLLELVVVRAVADPEGSLPLPLLRSAQETLAPRDAVLVFALRLAALHALTDLAAELRLPLLDSPPARSRRP